MSIRISALFMVAAAGAACAGQPDNPDGSADSAAPGQVMADSAMAAGGTMPSLFDISWNLTELNGATPPAGSGGRPATLLLDEAEGRASGFAGCNRMTGSFTHAGDSISFGPMGMTRMACEEGMELEQQYATALGTVTTLSLTAGGLELMGDSGTVARFSAAPPEE